MSARTATKRTDAAPSRRKAVTKAPDGGQSSRAELVIDELRKALFDGRLKSGQRLLEREVADWLGVSRTPVREALHKLTEAGLLVPSPPRGMIVVTLTSRDVIELYAVREALEGTAASLAAQHASPAEVTQIHAILDKSESERDELRFKHLNWLFHNAIYDAAHNAFLLKSLHGLAGAIALLPGTTFEVQGRREDATSEHRQIAEAIGRRDSEAAGMLARQHILRALDLRLRKMFNEE